MSKFGKKDLVDCIANNFSCTKKQANRYLEFIFDNVIKALKRGDDVELPGFRLGVVEREACERRNPKTGEKVQVEAKKVVKIKALKQLKDALNG